jgi:predicted nucleic acid-binding protein
VIIVIDASVLADVLLRTPDAFALRELRDNLSAYDAAYVALAESLGATLITRDRRVASAAGHHVRIELV